MLIEGSGGVYPVTGQPYSIPVIYNSTFIGRGENAGNQLCIVNNNGGGIFANNVFLNQMSGFSIEYVEDGIDSYRQFEIGNLQIESNIFHNVAQDEKMKIFNVYAAEGVDVSSQNDVLKNYFDEGLNEVADPGIELNQDFLYPIPGGNVFDNLADYPDPWFEPVSYKGAFYTYNWASGWTLLSQSGYLKD